VETAVLSALAGAVRRRGGRELVGEYEPTAKNGQVAGFFPAHGFAPVEGEERRWRLDLEREGVAAPEVLAVEFTDEVTDERKASGNNG
jgi:predicted enzyme involved in methoxymalonyl-ACP biosynthesis